MNLLQQGLDAFRQRQQQRADARLNYQLAQRPVTPEEILARELALADANEFALDTPQGQVINPQLAQLIAEGMALQGQAGSQALANEFDIPMGTDFQGNTLPQPVYERKSNPLQDISNLLGLTRQQNDPDQNRKELIEAAKKGFSRLDKALVASTAPWDPSVRAANPVQGQQAAPRVSSEPLPSNPLIEIFKERPPMVEAEPLMQELNTSPNEGLFTAQPSAIAQELMNAGQAQAPAEASFGQRLTNMFQRPETQEFILQTLLGLARSESVGDALTGGIAASRALGEDLQSRPAREAAAERAGRKEEAEIRRLETQSTKDLADAAKASVEIEKLSAETQKLLTATPDKLDDKEYFQVWTPVFKEVVAGEYLKDESEANLTSEELATKIVNSRFDTANRRFVTPGAEAESRLRFLQNQVDSGAIPEQEIIDMVKHYSESIYGPANTAELINRLKGN